MYKEVVDLKLHQHHVEMERVGITVYRGLDWTGLDAMRCDARDAGRMEKGKKKRRGRARKERHIGRRGVRKRRLGMASLYGGGGTRWLGNLGNPH